LTLQYSERPRLPELKPDESDGKDECRKGEGQPEKYLLGDTIEMNNLGIPDIVNEDGGPDKCPYNGRISRVPEANKEGDLGIMPERFRESTVLHFKGDVFNIKTHVAPPDMNKPDPQYRRVCIRVIIWEYTME
jgi:hypothetical protein